MTCPDDLYVRLTFPPPLEQRPYLFINMVSSADGKTLLGERGSTAAGLGSRMDFELLQRIRGNADWVIIAASTLRVEGKIDYAKSLGRAVVTNTGNVPLNTTFFSESPDRAVVFTHRGIDQAKASEIAQKAVLEYVGDDQVSIPKLMQILRQKYNVHKLLGEGGAAFNASLFDAQVVDELFLTLAPKIRGGAHLPTVVDGPGLPPDKIAQLELLSLYGKDSELYLRYRVRHTQTGG